MERKVVASKTAGHTQPQAPKPVPVCIHRHHGPWAGKGFGLGVGDDPQSLKFELMKMYLHTVYGKCTRA